MVGGGMGGSGVAAMEWEAGECESGEGALVRPYQQDTGPCWQPECLAHFTIAPHHLDSAPFLPQANTGR